MSPYQVPVAKGRSAFAAHEAIGIKSGFLSSRAGLGNHVRHVAGSEELPLLDIDGFARLRTGPDEVRLAAKESRRLKHIHDRREVCREPLAAYPGCTQGLHINEPGEKGCLLVTAEARPDGGYAVRTSFRPLGPCGLEDAGYGSGRRCFAG